jgi:hypothetical protein
MDRASRVDDEGGKPQQHQQAVLDEEGQAREVMNGWTNRSGPVVRGRSHPDADEQGRPELVMYVASPARLT